MCKLLATLSTNYLHRQGKCLDAILALDCQVNWVQVNMNFNLQQQKEIREKCWFVQSSADPIRFHHVSTGKSTIFLCPRRHANDLLASSLRSENKMKTRRRKIGFSWFKRSIMFRSLFRIHNSPNRRLHHHQQTNLRGQFKPQVSFYFR